MWKTTSLFGHRSYQEDTVASTDGTSIHPTSVNHPIALVCDGLGGHGGGDVASQTATAAFMKDYAEPGERSRAVDPQPAGPAKGEDPVVTVEPRLRRAAEAANRAVADVSRKTNEGAFLYGTGMGTTIAAAAVVGTPDGGLGIVWASAGDSPIHLVDREARTVEMLNPMHNPPHQRNIVLSLLNGRPDDLELAVAPRAVPFRPGHVLVIASDGIDTCEQDDIVDLCLSPEALCDRAVKRAKEADKRADNVTVAVLDYDDVKDAFGL